MTGPQRRHDPQPLSRGWELAVLVGAGVGLAVGLAGLAGLGVASAAWGGGWIWPHDLPTAAHVLGSLVSGRPGHGLPVDQVRLVAPPDAVYACAAAAEAVLLGCVGGIGALVARYRRPGDARRGMATRREAAGALGVRPLREVRAIIRPDLYRPHPFGRWLRTGRVLHRSGSRPNAVHNLGRARPGAVPADQAGLIDSRRGDTDDPTS